MAAAMLLYDKGLSALAQSGACLAIRLLAALR
jgi:hypothetical protein